jgi:hypothetical protein
LLTPSFKGNAIGARETQSPSNHNQSEFSFAINSSGVKAINNRRNSGISITSNKPWIGFSDEK